MSRFQRSLWWVMGGCAVAAPVGAQRRAAGTVGDAFHAFRADMRSWTGGQWGTQYDPAQDVLRVPLTRRADAAMTERFTIAVDGEAEGGHLQLRWDRTELTVGFRPAAAPGRIGAAQTGAAVVSKEQFRSFQWIFGRWRGVGGGSFASFAPFYEEYRPVDDSTALMRTYRDSTFTVVTDSTRFEWRDGRMMAVPTTGNPFVVVRFAGDSVVFRSGDEVLYLRVSDQLWRAVFGSAGASRPYYELRRVGRAP